MVPLIASYEALGASPEVLADVILPGLGFILLALSSYWLAGALPGSNRGLASLLSVLHWAPAFVYGGFQTNLYALSIALAASRLLLESRLKPFLASATILGLWHPWTLAYYTAAWSTYLAVTGSAQPRRLALAAAPLALSTAANAALLAASGAGLGALAAVARPAIPDPGASSIHYALLVYVWGTMARPEVLLAAAAAVVSLRAPAAAAALAIPSIASPALSPHAAYRVLLEAPYPLLAHYAYKGRPLLLLAPAASWLYLLVNSTYY
jgi:hypothetical protein